MTEMNEQPAYLRWPNAICGCCLRRLEKGATVLDSEYGLMHWPECPSGETP